MLFGAEWHDGEVVAQSNTKKDCDRLLQEEERQNSSPEAPEAMETSQSDEVTDIPEAPEEVPLVQAVVPDHANFREVVPVAPETGIVIETSQNGEMIHGPVTPLAQAMAPDHSDTCDAIEAANSCEGEPVAPETSTVTLTSRSGEMTEVPPATPLAQAMAPDHQNIDDAEEVSNSREVEPVASGTGMVMETLKSGEETEGPEGSEAQEGPLKEEVLMTLTLPVDTSGQALGDNIPAALEFDLLPALGMSESDEVRPRPT